MIRVSEPVVHDEDIKAVTHALRKGEISGTFGDYISSFETGFAEYSDCRYGISTTSGTTALHLALTALDIGAGDEVIVPAFTNMASFFSVSYTGAIPIPIDIEATTFNLDSEKLEALVTARTKAIMVVHIFGQPANMLKINKIAKKYGLFVIEDAAEAHGATYHGKKAGSLGDIAAFSFYANKIITTGEGGMVTTNNADLAKRCKTLQSLAYGKGEERFIHSQVGFNYRLTNYQAALGYSQLQRIDRIIERKREITSYFNDRFSDLMDVSLPYETENSKNVYWVYSLLLKGKLKNHRNFITASLQKAGIETRPAFAPYTQQKNIAPKNIRDKFPCPVAEDVGQNSFYIPNAISLTNKELEFVSREVKSVICNS